MTLHTEYLPAEKARPAEVRRQHELLAADPVVRGALDAMLNIAVVLNRQRQVVYANKALVEYLKLNGLSGALGLRMGDLFGCRHACETPGGCGTTEHCRSCGAAKALAAALDGGEAVEECRILAERSGGELDLRVRAKPFEHGGEHFLIASFQDISAEKRREALERIFFHDIINTAGGVREIITLMTELPRKELGRFLPPADDASGRLMEQILSQRDLCAAERGELLARPSKVGSLELIRSATSLFSAAAQVRGLTIKVNPSSPDAALVTDKVLLARVLGNLLKNAIEAEHRGAEITLGCRRTRAGLAFYVHNPRRMSDEARLQIFQRSFSTKGPGRGLGAYSIRLLTEKYLKGKVYFSTGEKGTTFTAEYPLKL